MLPVQAQGRLMIPSLSGKLARFWRAPTGCWTACAVRQCPPSSAGGCHDRHAVSHSIDQPQPQPGF